MNEEISKILYEIAILLEMKNIQFKPRAYEKASHAVSSLSQPIEDIYKGGGLKALMEIPGIGQRIAEKIEKYIKTGHIPEYERLKKKVPVNFDELIAIEGLGPKKILKLYKLLKIKNRKNLEKALKAGKLRKLQGFGPKTEQNLIQSIEFLKSGAGRAVLGFQMPGIRTILEKLREVEGVERVEVAGSVRRMQETIGDLDILAISKNSEKIMDFFTSMPEVLKVHAKGTTRSAVHLKNGLNADLRVVPPESFGAALQYFTGDKYHNVQLRQIAIKKGYKLNEYGLYTPTPKGRGSDRSVGEDKWKLIAGQTEEEIYEKLGMQWMPPEMRTNSGEIEAAIERKMPKLISYDDLQGDLQVQTDWTDGDHSIKEMAEAAKKLGLKYICITDHTKSLAMTGGNDEKGLLKQMAEIDKIQKHVSGIKILKGTEVNIMKDGSLDIEDGVLAKLDVVGAAVHSLFHMTEKEMTDRIIKAMENPNVDIIFHPTGRVLQKRGAYKLDMDAVIKAAKRTETVLEIDAFPDRLDLKDEYIRKAIGAGVKLSIDSDAHSVGHFQYLEFGIGQARRGWATAKDIINTRSWQDMLRCLK